MTTVVLRLAERQPILRRAAHHAWTACLSAALTLCALTGALTTALTICFTINPVTHGPLWQILFAPPSAAGTAQLGRHVYALIRQIRERR